MLLMSTSVHPSIKSIFEYKVYFYFVCCNILDISGMTSSATAKSHVGAVWRISERPFNKDVLFSLVT